MKKLLVFIISLSLLCGTMLFSETLDEILAKNYEARGGLDKLKGVKTMTMEGKIDAPMQNMQIPVIIWFKSPNKMKMISTIMENKITVGFDGEKAWMVVPMLGTNDPQEMPEDQAKQIREQADSMMPLIDYKKRGDTLEYAGTEDMEGTEVYKLKMTKKGGRVVEFYLDTESGIELKTVTYVKTGETETKVEMLFGDYKEVDGIMTPFSLETRTGAMAGGGKIVVEKMTYNEKLDDAFFAMPPKKAAEEKKDK